MNDRFRFRVWDGFGELFEVDMFDRKGILDLEEIHDAREVLKHSKAVLMQCTGIRDKSGELIWEGDVVREGNGPCGFIEWRRGGFLVAWHGIGRDSSVEMGEVPIGCKVIGNKFENPELLED